MEKLNMETIKSVTSCPTCGAECKIGGDHTTHWYIPAKKYSEEEMKDIAISFTTSYLSAKYQLDNSDRKTINKNFDKFMQIKNNEE